MPRRKNKCETDDEKKRNLPFLHDNKRLLEILELVESQYKLASDNYELATKHYELWKNLLTQPKKEK